MSLGLGASIVVLPFDSTIIARDHPRIAVCVAVIVAVAGAACGGEPEATGPTTWTLGAEELRIGSFDDTEESLTDVAHLFVTPWDQVLIAQPEDGMVRVHDVRTGRLIRRLGRPGDGPGEFRVPNWITLFSRQIPYDPIPIPQTVLDSLPENTPEAYVPRYYPPVSAVVAGRDGTTWVARETTPSDTRRWDVFDASGELIGAIDAPADLEIHDATAERIWAVTFDEYDVPYVVRLAVLTARRPAP